MDGLLDAVRPVCADARAAGPDDAFAGRRPGVRATVTGTGQVSALLTATAPLDATIGVRGGGTKAGLGPPARSLDLLLDTVALDAVLEYDPGDLVVRAQAGVRLEVLQQQVGAQGQWLGLDPPEPGATLGGIVATAASGPRRHRYGTVRDLLIGATFVLADGTCARTGGKVVKNVAGYDLGKLLTGSLGTLAVLTEVTFRLHPRPRASAAVTVPVSDPRALRAALASLLDSRLEPAAVELDVDLATGAGSLVLLVEGRSAVVEEQAARAADLLSGVRTEAPPPWWGRHPWDDGTLGLRVACPPSAVPAAVRALGRFAAGAERAQVRGRAVVGVLEAGVGGLPGGDVAAPLEELRAGLERLDATAVVTALPTGEQVDRWGPVRGLHLMRAVKDRFDPTHRLAPGRFVGGI